MIVPNGPDAEWSVVLGMGAKDQNARRERRAGNDRAERESSRSRGHYLVEPKKSERSDLGAPEFEPGFSKKQGERSPQGIEGAISNSWSKQPRLRK